MFDNSTNRQSTMVVKLFPRTFLRGVGQVMFQDSKWTGLLFLCGIFWGAYAEGSPLVAWGALAGTFVSTLTGYLLGLKDKTGAQGLWGFNGTLVGCAFPTFLGSTVWMWIALVLCAAMTTWLRSGMDNILGRWKVSSFTFPFVFSSWLFLLAAHEFAGIPPAGLPTPVLPHAVNPSLNIGIGHLMVYWLKGISQVFLINNWVTGIVFLAALACSSLRAAIWAALASAVALFTAIMFGAEGSSVAEGLYSFSAVLTGIALGATFCNFSWKSQLWALAGVIATVFVQGAMNAFLAPMGIPTLTGPFCVATWIFLFPAYKWYEPATID